MQKTPTEIENIARIALVKSGVSPDIAQSSAVACRFLESVGYSGLKILLEALSDSQRSLVIMRDGLGLDLKNVSCVFIASDIAKSVEADGRVFLRNVRHGLYLLPVSVNMNIGIGCPVDPGFALGGERAKNPYAEKLVLAEINGVLVDNDILHALEGL